MWLTPAPGLTIIGQHDMSNYRDSLNLPRTDFPMRGNLPKREPEILAHWDTLGLYRRQRRQFAGRPRFILHDGPPYANGDIHVGHVVNKVLKDMIVKSKSLEGFDAPYVPGWDCHGLPIELEVERKFGNTLSPEAFRSRCREYAGQQIQRQREGFIRLGVVGDWDDPYLTMAPATEAEIIRSLAEMLERGYLERGVKPVFWCRDCRSALAEAEVEYMSHVSTAVDVEFAVTDPAELLSRFALQTQLEGAAVPIWTTTPWTLPANRAVALHPQRHYGLVACTIAGQRRCLVLTRERVDDCMARYAAEDMQILATCQGQALEGLMLRHPFETRTVPVILADYVTAESGTGAVHIAPAHGLDDYRAAQHYRLEIGPQQVDDSGSFVADTPICGGMEVNEGGAALCQAMQGSGVLLHSEQWPHSYPHCWRHKSPLLFRATPQWFVSMQHRDLLAEAIAAVTEPVDFVPDSGRARMLAMLEDRPAWCVSRQRSWGVPIPLFIHRRSGELHPNTRELLEQVASRVEAEGIEAWSQLTAESLLGEEAAEYEKSADTLDVWFDSGVTHRCVLRQREELAWPADVYLEGTDQHRGWFQSSLLTAMALDEAPPYRQVVTHGFTVDADGRKMSKSLGNVIAPQEVISRLGADVLRLWVAATDYRDEMRISDEVLKRMADAYRRIRNTARFMIAAVGDFNPASQPAPSELLTLDRWILRRAAQLQQDLREDYAAYRFHRVYQRLNQFCVAELGAFHLDIVKDRMYTTPAEGLPYRSAQTALYWIADAMVRWMAPILSFTAEEIWRHLPHRAEDSVFLSQWSEGLQSFAAGPDTPSDEDWQFIIEVREAVNGELEQLRSDGHIGSGLQAEVELYADESSAKRLALLGEELRFVLITSEARCLPLADAPDDAATCRVPGVRLRVRPSTHAKCARCWHYRQDVGTVSAHPDLCERCVGNISGSGEQRRHA